MSLVENLNWRYATKAMNGAVVPQEKVDYILEAAHLAPSSSGLQPFKIIVVTDPELKAKIQPIAFNQPQIVDGSHLLIFAAWDKYTEERVNAVFEHSNKERGLPSSATDDYRTMLLGMFAGMSEAEQSAHAAKQSYISFGIAAAAAAEQRVDATPMEGFNKEQLDELLGLNDLGLKSATILALGYRNAENDWLVNMKKVRTPKDEFFIYK